MTGAWPAGCVPSGNNGDSNSGNTGEDAGSNTDGGFNVPGPNSTPMRFPETQEREFNADDFRRNVGLMRDTFRSFATDLNEGRPIPCGSYIGWINLWIIDSPVYTNVPDEFKALHVEWRWMLNEIVVRTDDARQFCSGTETGEKEVDLVPAIEFLIWGYPRSEQMVAELAAIPNP